MLNATIPQSTSLLIPFTMSNMKSGTIHNTEVLMFGLICLIGIICIIIYTYKHRNEDSWDIDTELFSGWGD